MKPLFIFTTILGVALVLSVVTTQSTRAQCVPPPSDIVAWWPLDETASPTNDLAGLNNVGAWTDNPVWVAGKVAGALRFDRTNCVTVPDQDELDVGTGNFSIDMWIQTVDSSMAAPILDKRTRPGSIPIGYVVFLADGYLGSQIGDGVSYNNWVSTGFVADGKWHHIAITVDKNKPFGWLHYLDGSVVPTPAHATSFGDLSNTASLLMARNLLTPSQTFAGTLDEVELFKRALDSSEIRAIWAADSLGKCRDTFRIEGAKWWDEYPHNCIKDGGEQWLSGWTINLSPPGLSGGTAVTGTQGEYTFGHLSAGTYTVTEEPEPGWNQVCPTSPTSYTVSLSSSNPLVAGLDFGNDTCHTDSLPVNTGYNHQVGSVYTPPGTDDYWGVICNPEGSVDRTSAFVINRFGGDGWAEAQPNSQWISSQPLADNDSNGVYCFEFCFCLEQDSGYVELDLMIRADDIADVFLNGYSVGTTPNGTFSAMNPPAHMSRNSSQLPNYFKPGVNCIEVRVHNTQRHAMGLNMTGYLRTVDPRFAIIPPECCDGIHGVKWHDMDGDCIKDHSEPVLSGWTINLVPGGTSAPMSCVTNANGQYSFGPLTPYGPVAWGNYKVDETPQPATGWKQVCPTGGVPPGSYAVNLAPGQGVFDLNFANDTCAVASMPVNTGYDHETKNAYSVPGSDSYWGVICNPKQSVNRYPAFVIAPLSAWASPQPNSQWISSQNTADNNLNGTYCFEYCFCLKDGYTSADLDLWVRADDIAEVFLNGFSLGTTPTLTFLATHQPAHITANSAQFPSYFRSGVNCIEIRVYNTVQVAMGLNMTGFVNAYPENVLTPECCDGIHGIKWYDRDLDCIKDNNEPALSGYTINLTGTSNGSFVTTQGQYFFGPLIPGQYTVAEALGQPGWRQLCPMSPGLHNITLQLGDGVVDRYFGNIEVIDTIKIGTGGGTSSTYDLSAGSTHEASVQDSNWGVTCNPMGSHSRTQAHIVGTAPGWAAPLPGTQWIGSDSTADNKQLGAYCFDYRFCLGDWFTYAELFAELRADDSAVILLNGHEIGATPDSSFMKSSTVVSANSLANPGYFQPGLNRIEVRVLNNLGTTMGLNLAGYVTADTYAILAPDCCNVSCCVDLVGNVDCDPSDGVDVGDLTTLIDNLFITFTPLCCEGEANCDGAGGIDVSDLTALIDNLFINFTPLPACQ